MDPLSATGLASCVMQMIDFSSKIIVATKKIHDTTDGQLVGHSDLEKTTISLQNLVEKLDLALKPCPGNEAVDTGNPSYQELGHGCHQVASELLEALSKLKGTGKRSLGLSLRQALLTVWKQGEIDALKKRLAGYKQQLTLQLLISLR